MSAVRSAPNSQQLLAHLESLLTQTAEPTRAEVEAAHGQASAAIRRVNERLTQAHQLISSGRRAEAIEIAEGPPHVLDEIASLDSQMLRDWEHYTGQFGLPRFAPLRSDLASMLNGAYTAENQLDHLLRRHRTLSIGRANLKQRIATLAQLSAADPSSDAWTQSMGQCQRIRLEQLAARAREATKLEDLRCLNQLFSELRGTRWVIPVPKPLVEQISGAIAGLRSRESTTEAIAIADHLRDAYSAGDMTRIGPLVRRYRDIESYVDPVAVDGHDDLVAIIGWHDQQIASQQIAARQTAALQTADTISDASDAGAIREVIETIATTGASVPTELRDAYSQKVQAAANAKKLKTMVIAGGVAATLLIAASIAGLVYRSIRHEAAMKKAAAAIDDSLITGNLSLAGELLATAPMSDDRFAEYRVRLDQMRLTEKVRADKFALDADALADGMTGAKGVDEFEKVAIKLNALIDRVETDAEAARATELTNELTTLREDRAASVIAAATEANARIRAELKMLVPDRNARGRLSGWNQELQVFRTDRWLRDQSDLLSALQATSDAVADQYDMIRQRAEIERSLEKITASVGDWDAWQGLADGAEDQDSSVTGKFLSLASVIEDERDLWNDFQTWNDIAERFTVEQLLSADPQTAADAARAVAAINRAGLADLPAAADFLAAAAVATPVAMRTRRTVDLLVAHLKSAKMSSVGAIKVAATPTTIPQWHYFAVDASGSGGDSLLSTGDSVRVQSYRDLAMIEMQSSLIPIDAVALPVDFAARREAYVSGQTPIFAPHVPLARSLLKKLEPLPTSPASWDRAFVESLGEVLAADSIDPLVQYFLATALLDIGSQGSWPLAIAYGPHRDAIRDGEVTTEVDWIAPGNAEAARTRTMATAMLGRLETITRINPKQTLTDMRESLNFAATYRAIGWIDQTAGRWIVRTSDDAPPVDGDLVVRYPRSDGSGAVTRTVGRWSEGVAMVDDDLRSETLRVGRPVWLAMENVSQ